jgi:predicted nucleotidyltransferase
MSTSATELRAEYPEVPWPRIAGLRDLLIRRSRTFDHRATTVRRSVAMHFDRDALASLLARYPLVAAYLFGSQVAGDTTPLSDVDIAVLLERGAATPGLVRVALISDLTLLLGRNDVDVVVLNTASPLLKERVISRGQLLYCRDDIERVRFEVAARREYFDTEPLRRLQDQDLIARYAASK